MGCTTTDKPAALTASKGPNPGAEVGVGEGSPFKEPVRVYCKQGMTDQQVLRNAMQGDASDTIDIGEILDGSLNKNWFSNDRKVEREADGRSRLLAAEGGPKLQRAWFSGRKWQHGCHLPMPSKEELREIEVETDGLESEADPGPKAQAWLERVDEWVYQLELWFRGTNPSVVKSWENNIDQWEKLLRVLPAARRERVLRIIREGARLPWDGKKPIHLRDKKTGGCPANNPRLGEKKDKVWSTLYEQLVEGAVAPWNCQGREDNDVLPKGMYAINWQTKAGSDKVRITANMIPLKDRLCPQYSKGVELPTVQGCRLQHILDDYSVAFDLHSSYHHGKYHKSARTWLGFSIKDDELPTEAIEYLWEHYSHCRFNGRWVFVYHAFAMGASPSVADFQDVMQAVVDACLTSGVGAQAGAPVEAWRGFCFIDDIKASSKGGAAGRADGYSGFGSAVELALQLLATLLSLGCFVNFAKSDILPRQRDNVFLGIGHNNTKLRFFLPKKRIAKLDAAIKELRAEVRVGGKVSAKLVARIVGLLWSCHVCCHKAVAIMCRGMIRTLAVMLGMPELMSQIGTPHFRWVLKRAWRGDVIWTWESETDLQFWEVVPWEKLWAPYGFDTFVESMKDFVRQARVGELAEACRTVASDASEVAVGGGLFNPVDGGMFECEVFSHHMLRICTKKRSSALRELEGIVSTIVSLRLRRGSRVIAVVDNEAVWRILTKGSGREELQQLAKYIFLYCVRHGIVLFSVWQRRSTQIMTFCDAGSRVVDRHAYSAHPGLFWEANRLAIRIWGRGFTFDRFGSPSQVQPSDSCWKLPFSSRLDTAFTSGVDALTQRWHGHVNWVNAPFGVMGKVLALLREQEAVAAVVVPRGWKGPKHWWQQHLHARCEGVVHRWDLHKDDFRCAPIMQESPTATRRYGIAVVFVDFRRSNAGDNLAKGVAAEVVQRAWVQAGRPNRCLRYLRPSGEWMWGLPFVGTNGVPYC